MLGDSTVSCTLSELRSAEEISGFSSLMVSIVSWLCSQNDENSEKSLVYKVKRRKSYLHRNEFLQFSEVSFYLNKERRGIQVVVYRKVEFCLLQDLLPRSEIHYILLNG